MDTQTLSTIVQTASNSGMITGTPGNWSVNTFPLVMTTHIGAAAVAAPAPAIPPAQAALITPAIVKSNAAAQSTPSAATGGPVTSNTPPTTITNVIGGLNVAGNIGADISKMEQNGVATLHWWGWEANLKEPGTQALLHLLTTDATGVCAILAALGAISPVCAAIGATIAILGASEAAQVKGADEGNGVVMKGYLWVGVDVVGT